MISIEVTLRIALEAHTGQKDLDGNPAILHPLAVGTYGQNGCGDQGWIPA